jgi:prevent-host-death family protein
MIRMRRYPSTELKQHLGDVLDAASREPVAITKHNKARYVIMSVEAYESRLARDPRDSYATAEMPDEHLALIDQAFASADD